VIDPPRAVVVDFDLTLADSSAAFLACHAYAAEALHLPPPSRHAIGRTIGTPLTLAFSRLFGISDQALAGEYARLYQLHADSVATGLTVMLPGAPEAITTLADAGIRLGIVSQKLRYRIEEVLRRDGLLATFDAIVGGDDAPFKPDSAGLLGAIEQLQTTVAQALYVGDTVIDAETADRAGVRFVGVLSGETSREELAAREPWLLLESVAVLPAALGLERPA
jgi:phosphoglycolate phosphatase